MVYFWIFSSTIFDLVQLARSHCLLTILRASPKLPRVGPGSRYPLMLSLAETTSSMRWMTGSIISRMQKMARCVGPLTSVSSSSWEVRRWRRYKDSSESCNKSLFPPVSPSHQLRKHIKFSCFLSSLIPFLGFLVSFKSPSFSYCHHSSYFLGTIPIFKLLLILVI